MSPKWSLDAGEVQDIIGVEARLALAADLPVLVPEVWNGVGDDAGDVLGILLVLVWEGIKMVEKGIETAVIRVLLAVSAVVVMVMSIVALAVLCSWLFG